MGYVGLIFNMIQKIWVRKIKIDINANLLERMEIEYDQIALVDSPFMIRWDAPNFFELTDRKFTAFRDTDNLKWVYYLRSKFRIICTLCQF